MHTPLFRLTAALLALAFLQLACYSRYAITTEELGRLDSTHRADSVTITTSNGTMEVDPTTPLQVTSGQGTVNLTPFDFTLTDSQLIAPDYNLLVPRRDITGATVGEFRKGRTIGLIVGSVLAAGAAFALVTVLAGEEDQ